MSTPNQHSQMSDKAKASQALDEALEDSFPASDPISSSPRQGGKNDKRVDMAAVASVDDSETTDAKTAANMRKFHTTFERRRR